MKKILALFFAGLLFLSAPGCEKPVDKADVPVPEVDMDGVPEL